MKSLDENEDVSLAEKAVNLYGGKYLAGEEDRDWIISFREHLLARFCRLVLKVGNQLEKMEKWDQAAKYYSNALDTDEILDEEIYGKLMAYYNRKGKTWNAMMVYSRLKRTLESKLGTKPSYEMQGVYKALIK